MKKNQTEIKRYFLETDITAYLLITVYIFFFSLISILKYNLFAYNDFDLAIHNQTLYGILHGTTQSSILGVSFLGNHLNFILFLIAPIYAVFRSPATLLFLQSAALGFSAYPIYLIAKEQLPKNLSLALLFSYLFYPSIGYVNLYEFHPTALATFFLSFLLYAAYKNKFGLFMIFSVLAMLCQENLPLIMVAVGMYLLIVRRPFKWWFTPIVTGALWFYIGVYKLIPFFGKGTIKFAAIYGHLTNLASVAGTLFKADNVLYLSHILGPVAYLPILSPVSFLGAMPTLLQHILSLRATEHTIYYHYTAEIIPFVFFSSIFALKRVLSLKALYKKENFLTAGLLVAALSSNWILGPHMNYIFGKERLAKTDLVYVKEAFTESIPGDAETAATFEFLPKLSNRAKLYSLHHAVMGTYTLSDMPYKLPNTTHYVLADFWDFLTFRGNFYNKDSGSRLRGIFCDGGSFGIVNMLENIVLFKRGFKSDYYLYKILPVEPAGYNRLSVVIDDVIELMGFDIDKSEQQKGAVSFRFYWRCLKKADNTYGAFINIKGNSGRLIKQTPRFLCYRIYPTDEWQEGQIIEESYRLLVPADMPNESCQIKMGIFDFYTGEVKKVVDLSGNKNG